jgi:hypothetical protein
MRLLTSWSAHFSAFGSSDTANINMAMFSDALDTNKSKMEKINNLIKKEDTGVLVKGKMAKLMHCMALRNSAELKFAPSSKLAVL